MSLEMNSLNTGDAMVAEDKKDDLPDNSGKSTGKLKI